MKISYRRKFTGKQRWRSWDIPGEIIKKTTTSSHRKTTYFDKYKIVEVLELELDCGHWVAVASLSRKSIKSTDCFDCRQNAEL